MLDIVRALEYATKTKIGIFFALQNLLVAVLVLMDSSVWWVTSEWGGAHKGSLLHKPLNDMSWFSDRTLPLKRQPAPFQGECSYDTVLPFNKDRELGCTVNLPGGLLAKSLTGSLAPSTYFLLEKTVKFSLVRKSCSI